MYKFKINLITFKAKAAAILSQFNINIVQFNNLFNKKCIGFKDNIELPVKVYHKNGKLLNIIICNKEISKVLKDNIVIYKNIKYISLKQLYYIAVYNKKFILNKDKKLSLLLKNILSIVKKLNINILK